MKKFLLLSLLFCTILIFSSCGSSKNNDTNTATESVILKGDSRTLDFDLTPSAFPNDVTGNWYCAKFAETEIDFPYYALDYYNKYFTDDAQVHVVYNFSRNTVYTLTCYSSSIYVNVTDYVKGEEHDAKSACSGTQLASYTVDISTGNVTEN